MGPVARFIQNIKKILTCFEEGRSATNVFNIKQALKNIIHELRISKKTKVSPFEAQFGRKSNTLLSVKFTTSKLSNLSFEGILKFYLDEDRVTPETILPDNKWAKGNRTFIEMEKGTTHATREANERKKNI